MVGTTSLKALADKALQRSAAWNSVEQARSNGGTRLEQDVTPATSEAALIQWLNTHPPQGLDPDHCAQCGRPLGRIGDDAVPFLTGGGGHAWLHHGCHAGWTAQRRAEAMQALRNNI